MRRRKKSHPEEHGNADRWLLTYADMITLLMAFFIMMYSMSVLNTAKFNQAAISIRSGFGGIMPRQGNAVVRPSGGSFDPSQNVQIAGVKWRIISPLVNNIEQKKQKMSAKIGEDNRGIVITLSSDQFLFEPGSAQINQQAYKLLDNIADTLGKIPNNVQIEGHTCDLQTKNEKYADNWELSSARAISVLRYLVENKGLPAKQFSVAGYGSIRPVSPNNTEKERSQNRRVEIVILRPEAPIGVAPDVEPRRISDPSEVVFQRSID